MTDNIIFLDFDGVINRNSMNHEIIPECLEVLLILIKKYNLKVVPICGALSFGLGTTNTKKRLIKRLNNYGIFDIDGFIETNYEGTFLEKKLQNRTIGIIDYLKKRGNVNYIIIDDENKREYNMLGLNYINTKPFVGLTMKHLDKFRLKQNTCYGFDKVIYKYKDLSNYKFIVNSNNLVKVLKKVYEKRSNNI